MLEQLQLHEHGTIWRQIGRQLVTAKRKDRCSDHTAGKGLARRINMVKMEIFHAPTLSNCAATGQSGAASLCRQTAAQRAGRVAEGGDGGSAGTGARRQNHRLEGPLFGSHQCGCAMFGEIDSSTDAAAGVKAMPASRMAISAPPSACRTMASFNQPRWPMRKTLPATAPSPRQAIHHSGDRRL